MCVCMCVCGMSVCTCVGVSVCLSVHVSVCLYECVPYLHAMGMTLQDKCLELIVLDKVQRLSSVL